MSRSDANREEVKDPIGKLGWPQELISYRREQLTEHFPEACVGGYEPVEACVTNQAKDRHVLAAAIRAGCDDVSGMELGPDFSNWRRASSLVRPRDK